MTKVKPEDLVGSAPVTAVVSRPTGLLGRFRRQRVVAKQQVRFRDSAWWLYLDVPPGKETNITFDNGVVTMARELPYDASERRLPGHEWTRKLMDDHLTRMEADPTYVRLVDLSAWHRLRSAEVERFVVTTFAQPDAPNQLGRAARRFGDLDVIVSFCEMTSADQLRRTCFPDGYLPVLIGFVDSFGIRPRQNDLAHWIFGQTSEADTVAHLAYLPADRDLITMLPWDLLSPDEQSRGRLSS